MGAVYVARHLELGREVALKVTLADLGESGERRFAVEARAVAQLQHPSVVAVHEVGVRLRQARPFNVAAQVDDIFVQ